MHRSLHRRLNRRDVLASLALLALPSGLRPALGSDLNEHYAESVAIDALSRDLRKSFGVRLGRFPPRGSGTLWVSAYIDGSHYAVADAGLDLAHPGASPIGEPSCDFSVSGSPCSQ